MLYTADVRTFVFDPPQGLVSCNLDRVLGHVPHWPDCRQDAFRTASWGQQLLQRCSALQMSEHGLSTLLEVWSAATSIVFWTPSAPAWSWARMQSVEARSTTCPDSWTKWSQLWPAAGLLLYSLILQAPYSAVIVCKSILQVVVAILLSLLSETGIKGSLLSSDRSTYLSSGASPCTNYVRVALLPMFESLCKSAPNTVVRHSLTQAWVEESQALNTQCM